MPMLHCAYIPSAEGTFHYAFPGWSPVRHERVEISDWLRTHNGTFLRPMEYMHSSETRAKRGQSPDRNGRSRCSDLGRISAPPSEARVQHWHSNWSISYLRRASLGGAEMRPRSEHLERPLDSTHAIMIYRPRKKQAARTHKREVVRHEQSAVNLPIVIGIPIGRFLTCVEPHWEGRKCGRDPSTLSARYDRRNVPLCVRSQSLISTRSCLTGLHPGKGKRDAYVAIGRFLTCVEPHWEGRKCGRDPSTLSARYDREIDRAYIPSAEGTFHYAFEASH
jgi:hypothetical protein